MFCCCFLDNVSLCNPCYKDPAAALSLQGSPGLCLLSVGIAGMNYHTWPESDFLLSAPDSVWSLCLFSFLPGNILIACVGMEHMPWCVCVWRSVSNVKESVPSTCGSWRWKSGHQWCLYLLRHLIQVVFHTRGKLSSSFNKFFI